MSNLDVKYFPHERLDAYRLARQVTQFVGQRRAKLRGLPGNLGPQLERAVMGAQTNLCAGAAAEGAERRRHFRLALTEAGEAGGAADAARDFGALSEEEYDSLRSILLRLCGCLYGLSHTRR